MLGSTFSQTQYPYEGKVKVDSMGLYHVTNPISGETLILKDITRRFRDPLTGAHLMVQDGKVLVVTPGQFQRLNRSKQFLLQGEADISLQTQRQTIHFNKKTNERVCTAGELTGMDKSNVVQFGKRKN